MARVPTIAQAAKTNIVSISYYFGSKQGLYNAAAMYVASRWAGYEEPLIQQARTAMSRPKITHRELVEILCAMLGGFLRLLLGHSLPDYYGRFVSQAAAGPPRAFRLLNRPLAPLRDTLAEVIHTFLEKLSEWLNLLWESAAKLQARAAWVGRVIVWGFILAVCVGLAWGVLQLERRWRIRLVPESDGPAAGAASARDWQLWFADARSAAAAGEWREAIHFVYWATISRLESKRLWPADRARTPREYLALVAAEDPRKAGLATLTGSFEKTWYGGRAARASDFQKAEELADGLISGSRRDGRRNGQGRRAMTFLSSLDAKDRKLMLWCVGIAIALAVATGFLLPNGNDNNNPLPSSYLAGQHGARAAYETLLRSGYPIERWEQPLSDLATTAGPVKGQDTSLRDPSLLRR